MDGIRRVLLADTGEEFRLGFAAAVENEPDIQIIGKTGDGEELLRLTDIHSLHYHWVKGHAENEFNNRCDELAVAESQKYK